MLSKDLNHNLNSSYKNNQSYLTNYKKSVSPTTKYNSYINNLNTTVHNSNTFNKTNKLNTNNNPNCHIQSNRTINITRTNQEGIENK